MFELVQENTKKCKGGGTQYIRSRVDVNDPVRANSVRTKPSTTMMSFASSLVFGGIREAPSMNKPIVPPRSSSLLQAETMPRDTYIPLTRQQTERWDTQRIDHVVEEQESLFTVAELQTIFENPTVTDEYEMDDCVDEDTLAMGESRQHSSTTTKGKMSVAQSSEPIRSASPDYKWIEVFDEDENGAGPSKPRKVKVAKRTREERDIQRWVNAVPERWLSQFLQDDE